MLTSTVTRRDRSKPESGPYHVPPGSHTRTRPARDRCHEIKGVPAAFSSYFASARRGYRALFTLYAGRAIECVSRLSNLQQPVNVPVRVLELPLQPQAPKVHTSSGVYRPRRPELGLVSQRVSIRAGFCSQSANEKKPNNS